MFKKDKLVSKKNLPVIVPISDVSKKDVMRAGGKGASLGELARVGIPVPPGFIITSSAFDEFLHETDLFQDIQAQIDRINYKDTNSVDRSSNVIRGMITRAAFPRYLKKEIETAFIKLKSSYVAVRSSATAEDSKTASWAGELETYLNTTEKTLIPNIKMCWSSLFTPRALFYRHEKKLLASRISVAVVIQSMVQSEISGITFTVHPVTKDKNQMIIEAVWGLGEAIVGGLITPDSYVVDKRNWSIIDTHISSQDKMLVGKPGGAGNRWVPVKKSLKERQKLGEEATIELARLSFAIERHYRFPQDIEWVYKGGFYITQSRPITTL